MSNTTISKVFRVLGVLTTPDTTKTIHVTRTDTGADVIAAGTDLTAVSTGILAITFEDPAAGLTYAWSITIVHDGSSWPVWTGTITGSPVAGNPGTLTAATIRQQIINRTKLSDVRLTDIDEEIINTLVDMTGRGDMDILTGTVEHLVTLGDMSFALPAGYKAVKSIKLAGYRNLSLINYDDYQMGVMDGITGVPGGYAVNNRQIYLSPAPDSSYTVSLDYSYTHPRDLTSIIIPDTLREALYQGVLALLFAGQLAHLAIAEMRYAKHSALYESELYKRQAIIEQDEQPAVMIYNDII